MKYPNNAALGLVVLALCVILLVTLVQAFTPTLLQTASPPLASPIEPVIPTSDVAATADAERLRLVATLSAEATATTEAMPPRPTPGAIVGPQIITDQANCAKLDLPAGWYASPPMPLTPRSYGVISLANYDFYNLEKPPAEGIYVDLFIASLEASVDFEKWVTDRRNESTMPDKGGFATAASDTEPIAVGRYKGFIFTTDGVSGQKMGAVVYLLTDNNQIIGISIRPLTVSTEIFDQAIAIVSSLQLDPSAVRLVSGLIAGPRRIYDSATRVSLNVPEGWFAAIPPNRYNSVEPTIMVANYDFVNSQRPGDSVAINLGTGPLPLRVTFDEWVRERHRQASSPDHTLGNSMVTDVTPITVSAYQGYTYSVKDAAGQNLQVILLKQDGEKVATIEVRSAGAASQSTIQMAEEILSALKLGYECQFY